MRDLYYKSPPQKLLSCDFSSLGISWYNFNINELSWSSPKWSTLGYPTKKVTVRNTLAYYVAVSVLRKKVVTAIPGDTKTTEITRKKPLRRRLIV